MSITDVSIMDVGIIDMSATKASVADMSVMDAGIFEASVAEVGVAYSVMTDPHIAGKDDSNNRPQTQTLLSSTIRHGGFGSPVYGVTTMNGQTVFLRGTRGAWIMNLSSEHALYLGLAGYRTRDKFEPADWLHDDIAEPQLRVNYGGFELEYVNSSYRLVHMGLQLLIGSGDVRYDDRDLEVDTTRDSFFVIQPGANLMLNVTRWFRISGGAYYRYAGNVHLDGTSDSDLSGITGILALRFGRF